VNNNPVPRAISCIFEDDEAVRSLDGILKGRAQKARNRAKQGGYLRESDSYQPLSLQLHSEYTSTYKWHEFSASVQQEVVKHPPTSSNGKEKKLLNFSFLLSLS